MTWKIISNWKFVIYLENTISLEAMSEEGTVDDKPQHSVNYGFAKIALQKQNCSMAAKLHR